MKYLLCLAFILLTFLSLSAQTRMPSFTAAAMDGSEIDTSELRGKVVVFNLWFINCPNCVEEITKLNQLVDEYKDQKDVVFIGLAASKRPELEKFLTKHPFKYKVVPNAQILILSKFGTPDKNGDIDVPFPMHYVIDRKGNVVLKIQGIKGVEAVKAEIAKQFASKE
jgi:peroxiredoxin